MKDIAWYDARDYHHRQHMKLTSRRFFTNPSEKYDPSNWIISPGKVKNKKYLESRWCPIFKAIVAGFRGFQLPKKIGHKRRSRYLSCHPVKSANFFQLQISLPKGSESAPFLEALPPERDDVPVSRGAAIFKGDCSLFN